MSLRIALSWGGLLSLTRVVLGFISAKVSAVYLGPGGMALVGQLTNFIDMLSGGISNAPTTAVVTHTSRNQNDNESIARLWGTAMRLLLAIGLAVALIAAGMAQQISSWLFDSTDYWLIIAMVGFCLLLANADSLVVGILNGLGQVKLISQIAILSTIVGSAIFVALAYSFGLWGGLAGILCLYSVKLPISLIAALRSGLITLRAIATRFDMKTAKEIVAFYPMLLLHAIAVPLSLIAIRTAVARNLDYEVAGFVQATWRLSDMYCGVLISVLGIYFIAHYSRQPTKSAQMTALWRVMLQMLALTGLMAAGIYMFRDFIIPIVLTREFLPMRELLPMQLSGDVLKMAGYPLQMALSAQRRVGAYALVALLGPGLYVLLVYLWLPTNDFTVVPVAYTYSYGLVLLSLLFFQRKVLFRGSREV